MKYVDKRKARFRELALLNDVGDMSHDVTDSTDDTRCGHPVESPTFLVSGHEFVADIHNISAFTSPPFCTY